LHQNACDGRPPPGPTGGAMALPRLPSRYLGEEREGKRKKGLGIGRERRGRGKDKKRGKWDRRRGEEKAKGGEGVSGMLSPTTWQPY